ncbi:hypothetical protein [Bacteroides neonati]|uniref:hypothetical protein n=1 Tax=Bacteroides neonati TaxID=1347393 RepID=UPI0004BAB474|nr:hypothetical protein [Bacteroides neonati]
MEKELKTLQLKTKANDVDEAKGIVTIAVNGIGVKDDQGETSASGSFDKTINEFFLKRGKHLLDHDKTKLIGCPTEAREENSNLIVVSKINLNKQIGKETFEDYKLYAECGKTLEHSIGVKAIRKDANTPGLVLEWFLGEVSTLQAWGANPQTFLVGIKSSDSLNTQRQKLKESIGLIQKALNMKYSNERLNDLDMKLDFITKALTGESSMVTCPGCGHSFDYDKEAETTFSNQVLDLAAMYQRWIIEGVVREEMDKLKPEIREQVLAVLDSHKGMESDLQVKSIEDIVSYVRCPHCWSRVYRTMIAKVADTNSNEPVAPSNDTQQQKGEKEKEKHETDLSLAAKISSIL